MKQLFLLLCILTSGYIFGQSTINFKKDPAGKITITDKANLEIPIRIEFDNPAFKNDNIEIFEENNSLTNGPKEIRVNVDPNNRTGPFVIMIAKDNNNKLKIPSLDINVPDSASLTIKINGTQVGIISYKYKNDKPQDSAKNDSYQAGYVYYDAMAIVSSKDIEKKTDIMRKYGYAGESTNPYLMEFYRSGAEGAPTIDLIKNLGNTDVTNFAAGLAKFLAERAKEELNEAFFNKMKEQLNAYPELKTAFPKTSSFLDQIETFTYASILNALRDAFEMDLQNLPENLYNIKGLSESDCDKNMICGEDNDCDSYANCQARLKKLSEFFTTQDGCWVALGMFSAKEGIQSTNPAELLKSIATSTELKVLKSISADSLKYNDYNIASSIELSNFISQSLISKDDKQVWINSAELKSLINTKGAFEVYLGLLLSFEQRKEDKVVIKFYKSEKANDTITLGMILLEAKKKYDVYKPQIVSLVKNSYTVYNSTNNAIRKMIAASDKSVEVEPQALYDYYRTLTSSLKPIANSPLLDSLIRKDFGTKYDKTEKYLTPSVDLAYHISTKKYSAAIYDASIILTALNELKVTTKNKNGKEKEVKNDGFKTVTKSFVKYGTLISTVASAQSSDEVKKAIEASVLPVGSSSIKRNSSWSISLNAYVGGYWSYQSNQNQIPIMGLSAPIGINFSKGFACLRKWGSLSANIQMLDLGALVNYYLLNGDTASIPNDFKVKLSNIFAPGFNVCYNIPKTPLSIAWGGQYIPTLYKYEQINGTNQLTSTNAFRMQVSLLVDIPLYNLKVWDFKK